MRRRRLAPFAVAFSSLVALAAAAPRAQAETLIKIATLAPEGSSWMKLSRSWQKAVEERTEGRVKIKFYAGGVQGDERDVLRKIRLGQLQGAAVTGIGLSSINAEVRALEVTRTYAELDHARAALGDLLRKRFEDKGFVQLSWGDVGPVHIFSNRPIRTLADLQATKMWMWSDDPITRDLFTSLGVHGVPLGVPDVLPALSTGQIDAFFGSPLSTLALQWAAHARYVSSLVIGQATGATVIAKKTWDALEPRDREALLDEARKNEAAVLKQVRDENARALATLTSRGLELVPTPPALEKEMQARGEGVAGRAQESMSPEFRTKVKQLLDEYRAKNPR